MPFGLQIVGGFRGRPPGAGRGTAMEQAFSAHAQLRRPRPDLAGAARGRSRADIDRQDAAGVSGRRQVCCICC
jgi:hypothetical protein